jgi:hypothetical protein
MSQFHKAERKKGKLRLAIAGPAGAGKTYSALLIAFGLGGKVAMIDTERGSGELYDHLGLYDACTIDAPFEPRKYVEAILGAEELGYGTIIIDSLSHAWSGQGGLLDTQGRIADKTGNSWSAWRQVTPKHNELVDTMLQSKCHIIATMRSKMEYTQVEENGKKQVKKLGMGPIQRDGMEYEFTVFMDLDHSHTATTTKDRTTLFDGKYFVPGIGTGKLLLDWLENSGKAAPVVGATDLQGAEKAEGEVKTGTQPHDPAASQPMPGESSRASAQATPRGKAPSPVRMDLTKRLYTRLLNFSLPWDNYELYCHKRYSITSLAELTDDQLKEQTKLLDSLKRPERLEAFREVLGGLNGETQGQAQAAAVQ